MLTSPTDGVPSVQLSNTPTGRPTERVKKRVTFLDPLETRRMLGLVLSLQTTEHATDSNYGVFRM